MKQEFLEKLPAPLRTILLAFFDWWDDLVMQSVMSLLWSISLLTVVLAPPLTFGIYYVQSQYVRGENPGLRGMWEGARKYFWVSWRWMLTNLLIMGVFYASLNAYDRIGGLAAQVGHDLTLLTAAGWLISQFYAIPFVMLQEGQPSLWHAWRNSLLLSLASPFYLLGLLVFLALFGLIGLLLVFPVILGYVSMVSILAAHALRDRLETFQAMAAAETNASHK